MLQYDTIIETVNHRFPEIQKRDECVEIINCADDLKNLPYLYSPAFWKLLEVTLLASEIDEDLLNRIFSFMEEMATCEDANVVDLMQIEMLEPLFGLEYAHYQRVVKRYLQPKTILLHQEQIPYFKLPCNPDIKKENKVIE